MVGEDSVCVHTSCRRKNSDCSIAARMSHNLLKNGSYSRVYNMCVHYDAMGMCTRVQLRTYVCLGVDPLVTENRQYSFRCIGSMQHSVPIGNKEHAIQFQVHW